MFPSRLYPHGACCCATSLWHRLQHAHSAKKQLSDAGKLNDWQTTLLSATVSRCPKCAYPFLWRALLAAMRSLHALFHGLSPVLSASHCKMRLRQSHGRLPWSYALREGGVFFRNCVIRSKRRNICLWLAVCRISWTHCATRCATNFSLTAEARWSSPNANDVERVQRVHIRSEAT